MSKRAKNSVSATQLSKLGYCENQVLLDQRFGEKRTRFVKKRAVEGNALHKRAYQQAQQEQQADRSPCFVASCVYGIDAPQTNRLRQYRDEKLVPTAIGRALVWTYYRLSPSFIPVIDRWPHLKRLIRALLDKIITLID